MKLNHPVTDREVLMKEGTILVTKTDLKGRIIYTNEDFIEISGFSKDELMGANHNIVRHPDMPPEAFADLWQTIGQGRPWRGLVKNRAKTGDYYWVEANVTPLYEGGRLVAYMSARYAPSREQIRAAEHLYDQIRAQKGSLRLSGWLSKLNVFAKLKLGTKIALTGGALLLPAAIMLAMLIVEKNQNIEFAAKEMRGVQYIAVLHEMVEHVAAARSLAKNALTGGDLGALSQARKAVESDVAAIDKIDGELGSAMKSSDDWQKTKQAWIALASQAPQAVGVAIFAKHSEVVEQIIDLMHRVSDQSNLTLDPEVDSYYLMDVIVFRLPELTDHLHELLSISTHAVNAPSASVEQMIEVEVLNKHVADLVRDTKRALAVANEANADLKTKLTGSADAFDAATAQFSATIEQSRANQQTPGQSSHQLQIDGMAAIGASSALNDTVRPQLHDLLQRRIATLEWAKWVSVGSVTLLTLLVLVVGVTLIRYITRNLAEITRIFGRLGEGEFKNQIDLDVADELGDVLRGLQAVQVKLNVEISETRQQARSSTRIERALDNVESCVMVANNNRQIIYMNKTVQAMFKHAEADIRKQLPHFDASKLMGANIDQFHKNPGYQIDMLARLESTHNSSLEIGGRHMTFVANPVKDSDGNRIGTVVEWRDRTKEVNIEREIEAIVDSVKAGELTARIGLQDKTGFFAKLSQGINELTDVIENVFRDVGSTMQSMAAGDLTNRITSDYQGVYLNCKNDINTTIDKLNEIFGQVNESAHFINNSSQEIASGNNNLSQRAEQQAANLEQTAASMEELTSTVKNNADNAQQANAVASNAKELAEKGGNVVRAAVSAMQEINESSNKIADIISVIDEIAFQTNLLALNASVEAARAGEQGRGFSVVATEVRNLAQRSATAARESKELIQTSVQKVRAGTEFVNETGKALNEIVAGVQKVGDIVAQIADASVEQSAGIGQVNQAVAQMDEITQQNAALAEEASAASVSMSDLSTNMVEMLSFFKTDKAGQRQVVHHATNTSTARAEANRTAMPQPARQPSVVKSTAQSDDEWQDF